MDLVIFFFFKVFIVVLLGLCGTSADQISHELPPRPGSLNFSPHKPFNSLSIIKTMQLFDLEIRIQNFVPCQMLNSFFSSRPWWIATFPFEPSRANKCTFSRTQPSSFAISFRSSGLSSSF